VATPVSAEATETVFGEQHTRIDQKPATYSAKRFSEPLLMFSSGRAARFGEAPAGATSVYALDFDGVLCDSVEELSRCAYYAALVAFPAQLEAPRWTGHDSSRSASFTERGESPGKIATNPGPGAEDPSPAAAAAETARIPTISENIWQAVPPAWLLDKMRKLRPYIETGYESILLVRMLIEERLVSERAERRPRPLTVGEIAANWKSVLHDRLLRDWNIQPSFLIELFGTIRDAWIARDKSTWLSMNPIYPGVADALNMSQQPVYIVTTKQERFVKLILEHAGIRPGRIPPANVYGMDRKMTKIATIKEILRKEEERSQDSQRKVVVHLVEDRLETLEAATISLLGAPVTYHLATWGYNDPAQRARAEKHPFIDLLDLPSFTMKMH
jgi:phosphoglycolate phosphatase-like HAD superfamily hydrolase